MIEIRVAQRDARGLRAAVGGGVEQKGRAVTGDRGRDDDIIDVPAGPRRRGRGRIAPEPEPYPHDVTAEEGEIEARRRPSPRGGGEDPRAWGQVGIVRPLAGGVPVDGRDRSPTRSIVGGDLHPGAILGIAGAPGERKIVELIEREERLRHVPEIDRG